ncbi:mCG144714, partial [Mus musculus]
HRTRPRTFIKHLNASSDGALISLLWNHQLDDWTTLKVRKLSSSPRGPPSFLPTCWTYAITLKYEGWICHPTLPSTRWPFRAHLSACFLQELSPSEAAACNLGSE